MKLQLEYAQELIFIGYIVNGEHNESTFIYRIS